MKRIFPSAIAAITATVMLAACGGSGGDSDVVFENRAPEASGRSGSVVVTGSATAARNGTYASNDVFLNDVEKYDPIGGDPEACRFRFTNLEQAGTSSEMTGDIRYQPGTPTIKVMFVRLDGVDYGIVNEVGTVNRTANQIDLAGARLSSGSGGEVITLTGSIPMRADRPEGC